MRRAARTDSNQEAIVAALRAAGASVQSLAAVGKGVPDLLVGIGGSNYLLECKRQREDRKKAPDLTEDQVTWMKNWRGTVHVVLTEQAALAFVVRMEKSAVLHVEQESPCA
jgi:Holliday junction resolvase